MFAEPVGGAAPAVSPPSVPRRTRLARRILWPVVLASSAALALLVGIVSQRASQLATREAGRAAAEMAQRYAQQTRAELQPALTATHTLAQAAEGLQSAGLPARDAVDSIMRGVLAGNPERLGIWLIYEPDAFDGQDVSFAGLPGYALSGRFMPYWVWEGGLVQKDTSAAASDTSDLGNYYYASLRSGREAVVEPYLDQFAGQQVWMTSVTVPLRVRGRVVGVAGADLALAALQHRLGDIRPFETGYAALRSASGAIIAHPDSTRLGQRPADAERLQRRAAALAPGEVHVETLHSEQLGAEAIRALVPLRLSDAAAPWLFEINLPRDTVLRDARRLRVHAALLGLLTLLLLGTVLWRLVRRVTRPLDALALADARRRVRRPPAPRRREPFPGRVPGDHRRGQRRWTRSVSWKRAWSASATRHSPSSPTCSAPSPASPSTI